MKIKLTHIQDAFKDAEAQPPKCSKLGLKPRSRENMTKLVVRFNNLDKEQFKEGIATEKRVDVATSVASEVGLSTAFPEAPATTSDHQLHVEDTFDDLETDPKILLARLTKPPHPTTSFVPKALFPGEPKFDKEYCLYTPHSFALLKPLFTSHLMDAADLFTALTGHRVPNESDKNYDMIMIELSLAKLAFMPYMKFMQDMATNDILAIEVKGLHDEKWCRLEWGRDTWNRGMEYWKRDYVREDSQKARKILGRRVRKNRLVGSGSEGDGDVDTDYRPTPQKKRRKRRGGA